MKDYSQDYLEPAPTSKAQHLLALGLSSAPALPLPANVNQPLTARPGRTAAPRKPLSRNWYLRRGKRAVDVAFVVASLPVSVPVVAISAALLWIEGGQPFYTQKRLGRNGKEFRIWKLRTMVCDADARLAQCLDSDPELRAEWDTHQKLKNDPRITRVGGVLRSTSMDELPQLWNVLKGDMSVVGPRPMMPEQLELYGDPAAYFALKPGITGMWQVSARNNQAFSYRSKIDAVYHATASFWGDLALMVRTVGVVIRGTGY